MLLPRNPGRRGGGELSAPHAARKPPSPREIVTPDDIAEGARYLAGIEPAFDGVLQSLGPPPLRRSEPGFRTLFRILASQQLSVAAADSIWRRVEAAGLGTVSAVTKAKEEQLAAAGLSGMKVAYVKGIAAAIRKGELDLDSLGALPDEEALERLIRLKGVGRWTAEIYLMFGLGRPDILPAGDLALREAARTLLVLPERPTDPELRELARPWSPWASVAARMLWQHYRQSRNREGVVGG